MESNPHADASKSESLIGRVQILSHLIHSRVAERRCLVAHDVVPPVERIVAVLDQVNESARWAVGVAELDRGQPVAVVVGVEEKIVI